MLTDTSGSLAVYGPMIERGFALGLDYATDGTNKVMGHPINVVTKDTASDVNTGVTVAREVIERTARRSSSAPQVPVWPSPSRAWLRRTRYSSSRRRRQA